MKIINLKIKNVLLLSAVDISPNGDIVVIGGNNEQGKTCVLDSIFLALGGKLAKHKEPLKQGEKKGAVSVDLGELTVTRTFTPKGGSLKVTDKHGKSIKTPQTLLSELFSTHTFDVLAWVNTDPKKQVEILKNLAGLDFTEIDDKRRDLYDERTLVNRDVKAAQAVIDDLSYFPERTETERLSITELIAQSGRIAALRQEEDDAGKNKIALLANMNALLAELESIKAEIVAKEDQLKQLDQDQMTAQKRLNALPSYESVLEKIEDVEAINTEIDANLAYSQKLKEYDKLSIVANELSKQIIDLDAKKAHTISNAEFPSKHLSIDTELNTVFYKNIPFDQCSSAEKLRVSVGMGMALNPKLKVLLIRDGSLLDDKNLAAIQSMAANNDYQIWIERVGNGEECSVIMEDGVAAIP